MRLSDLLSRLGDVTEDHDGYLAYCPVHADKRTPSLKLTLKEDGRLLITCRAGCPKADILRALKLDASDLFDVTPGTAVKVISAATPEAIGPGEIAGLRVFVDSTTEALKSSPEALAYLADRFGISPELAEDLDVGYAAPGDRPQPWLSRGFTRYPRITVPLAGFDGVTRGLQGRDLSGKCPARWVSLANVEGKTWAKYGYLSAGAGYNTVLICEGPGDGLTSVACGYDAVIIRGAGLARNPALVGELAAGLRGCDVVLAGDRDRAGAGMNGSLSAALVDAGLMVRQLLIPNEGWDLTDWREADPEVFPAALHTAVRQAQPVEVEQPASAAQRASTVPDVQDDADNALSLMSDSAREMFDSTDVGLAVRLRDYMRDTGGGVRYAPGLGFLVWDGTIWTSGTDAVRRSLHRMGAEMIAEGSDFERRLALKALTNRHIDGILKELPSVPGVPAQPSDFDADPELLSVGNGTLNLRTGVLRPHAPSDMITRRLDVAYVADAQAPRWDQFLTEVFPHHPDLPGYNQRLVGYGITGSTREQCFVFHFGEGANGKSVYLDVLSDVFRGITQATEFSTFEQRTAVGQASPELARLRGARLVHASETEKYARLAESLIKQLTGGDPVTVRFLHQNPFSYTPSFLLQVAGNYKPAILSQDHGIWRRVKLIPWEARFRGAEADRSLPGKLKAEAEGILAWAVRGAQEWYAHGLNEPATVVSATADFRESEDRLAEFIAACLVQDPSVRVAPMQLRNAYRLWSEDAGLSRKEVLSGWALGVELESRGFIKRKVRGAWGFDGIRLATDAERRKAEEAESNAADDTNPAPAAGSSDIFGQPREVSA
ncbi:phage/plasmid primase, P4 family [Streptomyces sp. CB03911]|uniref:phage/plasmid primase, P4 family n=1 Tax=Streptomyces sp. CB03911 TaxID=1804758 RepID=UPI00093CAF65|nr:phage/plasmid primase, P4 family [Streptomyces sp. CB03911]OKI19270.1 DNA primase [Streptomyces sp. CB03911]